MKRLFDILIIFLSLPLLIPIFCLVASVVRMKIGSPIFFKQRRPGLNEKIFIIYKFRTMTNEYDKNGII